MSTNYFEMLNKSLYGKTCSIGTTTYSFGCFYMGDTGVPMVMLKHVDTGYVCIFLLTNNLKLAFDFALT